MWQWKRKTERRKIKRQNQNSMHTEGAVDGGIRDGASAGEVAGASSGDGEGADSVGGCIQHMNRTPAVADNKRKLVS